MFQVNVRILISSWLPNRSINWHDYEKRKMGAFNFLNPSGKVISNNDGLHE